MTTAADIIAFLRARLGEEEIVAVEASRTLFGEITPTGEHWQWECEHDDSEVQLDHGQEYVTCPGCGGWTVGLRSVETYPPVCLAQKMPHLVLGGVEEISPVVARHIVTWDPARVLAEIAAKRAILDMAEGCISVAATLAEIAPGTAEECEMRGKAETATRAVRHLAQVHAEHSDFDPEWRDSL